jgi:hypothetical protein
VGRIPPVENHRSRNSTEFKIFSNMRGIQKDALRREEKQGAVVGGGGGGGAAAAAAV